MEADEACKTTFQRAPGLASPHSFPSVETLISASNEKKKNTSSRELRLEMEKKKKNVIRFIMDKKFNF